VRCPVASRSSEIWSATVAAAALATPRTASAKARPDDRALGGSSAVSSARQRDLPPRPFGLDGSDGLRPEPARRNVDDPPKGLVRLLTVGGRGEPQERERVLDLGPLIEADITDENVRDSSLHQRFFEATREGVASVEDREVLPLQALRVAPLDLGRNAVRLRFGIAEADHFDPVAILLSGIERLPESGSVTRDHGVR